MKFVPKQCKQCPFRKTSAPGWLGSYTVGQVLSSIWKGLPFFCHTATKYDDPRWEQKAMSPRGGKLCVGGLIFADKMMAPEREVQHVEIRKARKMALVIVDEVECMSPQEFSKHHSEEP